MKKQSPITTSKVVLDLSQLERCLGKDILMNRIQITQTSRAARRLMLAAMIILSFVTIARAQNDICLTDVGGLGGTPTVDGIVEGFTPGSVHVDPGWNNAVRFNLSGD